MKRWLKRIGKWGGITVATIVVIVLLLAAFILGTGPGARWALDISKRFMPGITVGSLEGRLARRIVITDIAIEMPPISAHVDTVLLDWRAFGLLRKKLHVHQLEIAGIDLAIGAMPPDTSTAPPPTTERTGTSGLPVAIMVDDARIRRVSVTAPGGVTVKQADIRFSGTPDGYQMAADVDGSAQQTGETSVSMALGGDMTHASVQHLRVSLLDGTTTLDGDIAWSPEVEWDMSVLIDSIVPGPALPDTTMLPGWLSMTLKTKGNLESATRVVADVDIGTIEGHLRGEAVSGSLSAHVEGANVSMPVCSLSWGGNSVGIVADVTDVFDVSLNLNVPDIGVAVPGAVGSVWAQGNVHGELRPAHMNGEVQWPPEMTWDLKASVDRLEPGTLMPDSTVLPGWVSIALETSGSISTDTVIVADVEITKIEGQLRDRGVAGSVSAHIDGKTVDVPTCELSWGDIDAKVVAKIADDYDVSFDLVVPDIGVALPDAMGGVVAKGSFKGQLQAPKVKLTVNSDSLRYQENAVGETDITVDADLERTGKTYLAVNIRDVVTPGFVADSVGVLLDGNRYDHNLGVGVASEVVHAGLSLTGALDDSLQWRGTLETLNIESSAAGKWKLCAPAHILASSTSADLDSLCLIGDTLNARVSVDGYWKGGVEYGGKLSVDGIDLAMLSANMPEGTSISGAVRVDAAVNSSEDTVLTVDARVGVGPGNISYTLAKQSHALKYDSTAVVVSLDSTGAALTLRSRIVESSGTEFANVDAQVALPGFAVGDTSMADQVVDGFIRAAFVDLSVVGALSREVGEVKGRLDVDTELQGVLADPRIKGHVKLTDGLLTVPAAGVSFRQITLDAQSDQNGDLSIDASILSGKGNLSVKGASKIGRNGIPRTEVTISGNRFEVVNTPEAYAVITPNFEIIADTAAVSVKGELTIPRAKIDLLEVPPSAVSVSPDVVIVGQDEEAAIPIDVNAEVRLALGDSVEFHGLGLRTLLRGNILAVQVPNRPLVATGELRLKDGTYTAYGQLLTVDPGRILFAGGPIENPGLDVRAYRTCPDNTKAGVEVKGTARKPRLTLYSDPAMGDADALSYLLTGRPMNSGGGDNAMLATAALAMGLESGNSLARSLGQDMGLDEARIDAGSTMEDASLVAGKYLTPQLYVSQSIGLFNRINTFRVRYMMTPRWTVQTESGEANGGDLLYRIERGE